METPLKQVAIPTLILLDPETKCGNSTQTSGDPHSHSFTPRNQMWNLHSNKWRSPLSFFYTQKPNVEPPLKQVAIPTLILLDPETKCGNSTQTSGDPHSHSFRPRNQMWKLHSNKWRSPLSFFYTQKPNVEPPLKQVAIPTLILLHPETKCGTSTQTSGDPHSHSFTPRNQMWNLHSNKWRSPLSFF